MKPARVQLALGLVLAPEPERLPWANPADVECLDDMPEADPADVLCLEAPL